MVHAILKQYPKSARLLQPLDGAWPPRDESRRNTAAVAGGDVWYNRPNARQAGRRDMDIRHFDATLGAEVRGVDLSQPLDEEAFAEIEAAWHAHAVLIFPDQGLGDAAHIAFTRRFGRLEQGIRRSLRSRTRQFRRRISASARTSNGCPTRRSSTCSTT